MEAIRLLSLLLLIVVVTVSGCESGSSQGPAPITFTPAPAPAGAGFVALYAPPVDVVPYPNDLYNPTGTKLAVPVKITSPLSTALNTLDGFSTSAVIAAPFNAPLDVTSLIPFNPLSMAPGAASIFVLNATAGTPLIPGLDYTVRVSTAAGSGDSVLEIVPLKPLAARTRYAFLITNRVRSTSGTAAAADQVFAAVRDARQERTCADDFSERVRMLRGESREIAAAPGELEPGPRVRHAARQFTDDGVVLLACSHLHAHQRLHGHHVAAGGVRVAPEGVQLHPRQAWRPGDEVGP